MDNRIDVASTPTAAGFRLPLELRLALRDLRGGLGGFTIFLICIVLGTAAIGTINSLSDAIQDAIQREGKELLGGDAEASVNHRQAGAAERAYLASLGDVSEVATMRAMARKADGGTSALVDLKAVDGAYPLYGAVTLEGGAGFASIMKDGSLAVERSLLDRLGIGLGDQLTLGRASFPVAAVIEHEPDRLAAGPALGARILLSLDSLQKTGLIEPGSLVRWSYRIKERAPLPAFFGEEIAAKFPEAGFLLRDSRDPSPGVKNLILRLTEFLTLTGLTAMLTGGIGVANAISAFIERRRKTIATYKSVGAPHRVIFRIFLYEIGLLALLGISIGLVIASAAPFAAESLTRELVPIGIDAAPQGRALALAGLFGLLTALPFILWPVGRAQQVKSAELFRDSGGERPGLPPPAYRLASFLAAGLLAAAAIALSREHRIAAVTCAAVLGVFALFWGAGIAIRKGAQSLRRPKQPELALALANIGGPGSLSRTIALSLGAGLTLLTAVSLVDASLTHEIKARLPEHAPAYFFIGIPKADLQPFEEILAKDAPGVRISSAPMLRGRIVALKNVPVEQIKVPPSAEWVLNGDRGLTYSDTLPPGSHLTEGQWWPPGYDGEPLLSFEADAAKALGLALGDTVIVNVIGRNLTARIANFRKVQWGSMDINFVMIFSQNALSKAPFNYLAALSWPDGQPDNSKAESAILKSIAAAYPTVSAINVKEALGAINGVFEKVMHAVRIAGSVTSIMGALVVAGALMAAQRRRIYEAVVLRALGASKRRIVLAHLLEYLALALSLSLIAAGLGLLAAWTVVTQIMNLSFSLSLSSLLQPSIAETIFVLALGAAGTLRVLSAKPAHYLRSE
jgi:putative ABC transport system permease protein